MKPFTLHSVLKYKEQLEDVAINNLTVAKQQEQQVEEQLQEQHHRKRNLIEHIEQVQAEGVDITELMHQEEHLAYVKQAIVDLNEELVKRKKHVAATRKELLLKSRDKQVLERLKEKQNAAYKKYLDKKEAAVLDEIAVNSHNSGELT